MSLHTWTLFAFTVFVLCGTPGPNMLHVMSRSVSLGFQRSMMAMLGCLLALVAVLLASAAGLSALLLASPRWFEALRYLGVAYLAWLGIKSWRDSSTPLVIGDASAALPQQGRLQVFRGGLLIGLSNPKLILFAAAFLPQFVDPTHAQAGQYAILISTFAACELFWYAVYGGGGHKLRRVLTRPLFKRWFDRATGVIFVGFGVMLLRFRPQ